MSTIFINFDIVLCHYHRNLMKTTLATLVLFACANVSVHAQFVQRSGVAAAGASQTLTVNEKSYYISHSIGQASVIGTATRERYTIRQGFQQPPLGKLVRQPLAEEGLGVEVFPNPFIHSVSIVFQELPDRIVSIALIDASGKIAFEGDFSPARTVLLPLEPVAPGSYLLKIQSGKRRVATALIKR